MDQNEITPHLFRTEYSKIVAVLCKTFRLRHIETAEDIASETFLKASEYWAIKGLPENPTAWLYTVAKNKAKDFCRHLAFLSPDITGENLLTEQLFFEFDHKNIADSQLEMMFAVCDPANPREAQISLALQILCGFSVAEIATAFLSKKETIKKRLQRARDRLRASNFQIKALEEQEIALRLSTVLTTLYLLFNEGYFSKTHNELIRKDLCLEALRLTLILTDHPLTNTPESNALLALMCFQSSRLEARTSQDGEVVLFDEQDPSLWDEELVGKGNYYLIQAWEHSKGEISRFHLEAAIAYWHTTAKGQTKWPHILALYDQLATREYSPLTALNRAFAYSKVHGPKKAVKEVEKLRLTNHDYYHGLLGYLYSFLDLEKAIWHYEQAIHLSRSAPEKQTLAKQVVQLKLKR